MRWPKWFWDLRDAWSYDAVQEEESDLSRGLPVEWDATLLDGLSDPEPMSPEDAARIRKIVSDTLEAEKEGRVYPGCMAHLDGMDGAALFFCDRPTDHAGFHRNLEHEVTWVDQE